MTPESETGAGGVNASGPVVEHRRTGPVDRRLNSVQRKLDRNFHWLLAAMLALFIGAAGEFVSFKQEESVDRAAIKAECVRVKKLRAVVNANSARQHDADQIIGGVLVQSSLLQRLSPQDRATRTADNAAEQRLAASLLYVPQTDCKQAVDNPTKYQPPSPRTYGTGPALPVK